MPSGGARSFNGAIVKTHSPIARTCRSVHAVGALWLCCASLAHAYPTISNQIVDVTAPVVGIGADEVIGPRSQFTISIGPNAVLPAASAVTEVRLVALNASGVELAAFALTAANGALGNTSAGGIYGNGINGTAAAFNLAANTNDDFLFTLPGVASIGVTVSTNGAPADFNRVATLFSAVETPNLTGDECFRLDSTGPTLISAVIASGTLVLTFNEPLTLPLGGGNNNVFANNTQTGAADGAFNTTTLANPNVENLDFQYIASPGPFTFGDATSASVAVLGASSLSPSGTSISFPIITANNLAIGGQIRPLMQGLSGRSAVHDFVGNLAAQGSATTGISITAPAALQIVAVEWRSTYAQSGPYTPGAIAIIFNNPIVNVGSTPFYDAFGQAIRRGNSDSTLSVANVYQDPGNPNAVLLDLFCCSSDGVYADGRDFNGLAYTWNYVEGFGTGPQDIFGNVIAPPAGTPFTIADRIAPQSRSISYHDTNRDGRLDAVGLVYSEPVTTTATGASATLSKVNATVQPFAQITSSGVLTNDSVVADAIPANNIVSITSLSSGSVRAPSEPARLSAGNALLFNYNPNLVNWDNNPATAVGGSTEAIPGTGGPAALTIAGNSSFNVTDAQGNVLPVAPFAASNPNTDSAAPLLVAAHFFTGDNQNFNSNDQYFYEQDGNPGDQTFNNRARLIASETLLLSPQFPSNVFFGPGAAGFFCNFFFYEGNTLTLYGSCSDLSFQPGMNVYVFSGAPIFDAQFNALESVTGVTSSDRTAPYARVQYFLEPLAFSHPRLVDTDADTFANEVRMTMSSVIDPATLQIADFSISIGSFTSGSNAGTALTLNLVDGVVPMSAPVLITYNGATDTTLIRNPAGFAVSPINDSSFAIGNGTTCPIPSMALRGFGPGSLLDCNNNSIPDGCDILENTSEDWNGDGIPDECQATLFFSSECESEFPDDNENPYPSIAEALNEAREELWCNLRVLAAAPLFQNVSLTLDDEPVDFTSRAGITISASNIYTLNHGSSLATTAAPLTIDGQLRVASNATVDLASTSISLASTGTITAFQGSTLRASNTASSALNGVVRLLAGATLDASNALSLGSTSSLTAQPGATLLSNSSITLSGAANLTGASLYSDSLTTSAGSHSFLDSTIGTGPISIGAVTTMNRCSVAATATTITAAGRLTFAGEHYANLTNSGRFYAVGNSLIVGNLTNNVGGIFTVQAGVTTLIGSLVNNGVIVGVIQNPARPESLAGFEEGETSLFDFTQPGDGLSIQGDFTLGVNAAFTLPNAAWRFTISGNFDCAINDPARFDLRLAELAFALNPIAQGIEAMSTDRGPIPAAYTPGPGNYPIGTLRVASFSLNTTDARDNDNLGQAACEAIYVENLIIEPGATLSAPNCPIYYKNLVNNGTIATPWNVIRVPPACPGDANRDGVVNFADITAVLNNWNITYPGSTGVGDANLDGVVNFADITSVLNFFGQPC